MKKIDLLLSQYGESHQNATNKFIHWLCVPTIMFSLFGLLFAAPFPAEKSLLFNWAAVVLAAALVYYLRLSVVMFVGFLVIGFLILAGNNFIYENAGRDSASLAYISLILFAAAWVGQFIGHKIEGKKPSFFQDVQFLLIGPAWLLHFIFKKVGIAY